MAGYEDSRARRRPRRCATATTTPATSPRATPTATITFVGRADDVFKASDYRISPFELESALIEHEAVAEVAVVPSPDPVRLAVPKAYRDADAGAAARPRRWPRHIFAFCREQLAPYKRVRRIEFVDELPKTISGKIRRVELRAQEVGAAGRRRAWGAASGSRRTSRRCAQEG